MSIAIYATLFWHQAVAGLPRCRLPSSLNPLAHQPFLHAVFSYDVFENAHYNINNIITTQLNCQFKNRLLVYSRV